MVVNCDQYMIAGTDRAHDMIAPNVDVDMNNKKTCIIFSILLKVQSLMN